MPFIRGRYHMNPVLGEALEATREAEAALLELDQEAQQNRAADDDSRQAGSQKQAQAKGPIYRVEIEAAEMAVSYTHLDVYKRQRFC